MRFPLYARILLFAFCLFQVGVLANLGFLWQAEELGSAQSLVERHHSEGGIYNALSVSLADYKYRSYSETKPNIVAIGTSRAMPFRGYFFKSSFYNLGGLVHGQRQAFSLFDGLLKKNPPRIAIIALDYWTFCSLGAEPKTVTRPLDGFHDGMGQINRYLLPHRLLWEKRITTADYFSVLFSGNPHSEKPPAIPVIGINAKILRAGFGTDGSMYGFNHAPRYGDRWDRARQQISAGIGRFFHNCRLSEENVTYVKMLDREFRGVGTLPIFVAPPLPGVVIEMLEKKKKLFSYIGEWRSAMKSSGIIFFDYHDISPMGSSDCEFGDEIHGGEVTYLRILLDMATQPNSPLRAEVDIPRLKELLGKHENRITIADNMIGTSFDVARQMRWNEDAQCVGEEAKHRQLGHE